MPTGRSLLFPWVCKRLRECRGADSESIDPGVTPDLVEDTDEPHTCAEPLPHLLQHLAGPVAGGEVMAENVAPLRFHSER